MKTLIVYYTLEGNTHYAAKKIASLLDADVLRVKPVKTYPRKGFRKFLWGGKSAVMAETPELEPYTFDASAYDRIVFGFPVWAGNVTPPLRTFIKENDLSLDAELVLIDPKTKPDPINEKKISGFCGKLK